MNLVASLVVRNEINRFVAPCLDHLLAFCDGVVVLEDASTDGTWQWLHEIASADSRLVVEYQHASTFYKHEGQTRNLLLACTLEQNPSHILPLDADELITDGAALRALVEAEPDVPAWHIPIREVWEADENELRIRVDGKWDSNRTLVWRAPQVGRLSFPNRALACGRVPQQIRSLRAKLSGIELLHLGWLDESERAARYARYMKHDGGRWHATEHLASIMWPAERIELVSHPWPEALVPCKDAILEHATVKA